MKVLIEQEIVFTDYAAVFEKAIDLASLMPIGSLLFFNHNDGDLDACEIKGYRWHESSQQIVATCKAQKDDGPIPHDFKEWMIANGWAVTYGGRLP